MVHLAPRASIRYAMDHVRSVRIVMALRSTERSGVLRRFWADTYTGYNGDVAQVRWSERRAPVISVLVLVPTPC